MAVSEAISPQLPVGAGRTTHRLWPAEGTNITVTGSGMTTNLTPRPGGQGYSGMSAVSYGGGVTAGALQDNVGCYDLQGASAAAVGSGIAFNQRIRPVVQQVPQNMQSIGDYCARVVFMAKGGFLGDSNADIGLQVCAGTRFPSFTMFNDFTPGFQFGPRGPARVSFRARLIQGGGITVDTDVAAGFMANINPNTWNQYDVRIIGATKQGAGVIKCLVNGIQVLPDISMDPALNQIPAPFYAPNNSLFYSFGVVNRGADNSPHFYLRTMEFITGPSETACL